MRTDNQVGQTPEHNLQTQTHKERKILRMLSSAFGFAASAMVAFGALLLLSPVEHTARWGLMLASGGFGVGLACLVVAITGIVYARRRP